MSSPVDTLRTRFRIKPAEARILNRLHQSAGTFLERRDLAPLVFSPASLKVHICMIRKAIGRSAIESRDGRCKDTTTAWTLTPEGVERVNAALEERGAA